MLLIIIITYIIIIINIWFYDSLLQYYLHSNYCVDEEQHRYQQNDVRQRLQNTDSVTALHVIK